MGAEAREPVLFTTLAPVPTVPAPVPTIREAVPTGSRTGSRVAPTGSLFPFSRGNGERGRTGRRARLSTHHCDHHVLVGLDDEPAGLLVRVDPYPLTPAGEVAALTAGRLTYALQRGCLERRNRWTIPGHPPSHDLLVLAEHDCTGTPDTWRQPPAPRVPAAVTASEGMPF